jgi:radical SAM-linked protein
MARRTPEGPPPPPVVQRVRVRYAKRGRLRFTSHRDFARAFERALRRAGIPMAYSAGFTPHPKISYLGAAPTGVASEAEYLEIGLARHVDVDELRSALDAALPDGLDIVDVVDAVDAGGGSLAERMQATSWRIDVPHVSVEDLARAVEVFLAAESVEIERLTKDGRKTVDARRPVVSATVSGAADRAGSPPRAILDVVVRLATPAVRPDDLLAALHSVAGLALDVSRQESRAMRLAQGPLDGSGAVGDPLAADRVTREAAP